jgi:F-type H+-transporting ATPase subunit b
MSKEKAFWPKFLPKLVIGAGMMVGGMWISANTADLQATLLEALGLPLDLGKTLAAIGVFLIVSPAIDFFYLQPLKEAIDDRSENLEKTFTEAEQLRSEMAEMKSGYEKQLASTEAQAREQIQAQIKEAQDLRKTLMSEASAAADDLLAKANDEITAEKLKALTELRVHVATLSIQAAEKIVGENMDSDKNRKLVDDFITSVEAKN